MNNDNNSQGLPTEDQRKAEMNKVVEAIAQHASVLYRLLPPGGVAEINFSGSKIIVPGAPKSGGKLLIVKPVTGFAINVDGGDEGKED